MRTLLKLAAREFRRPAGPFATPPSERRNHHLSLAVTIAATIHLALLLTACAATSESGTRLQREVIPGPQNESEQLGLVATVTKVVDGDTIIVDVADRTETVRLLGIDTPEKQGGPRPAECFGADASVRAAELMPPATVVLLVRDIETRDQFGRLLAYVHRADDGLFVNLDMVARGYATPLFFPPNTALEPVFERAGDRARRDWIGFWPACGAADVTITVESP